MRSMWLRVSLAVLVGVVAGCPSMVGMKAQAQMPAIWRPRCGRLAVSPTRQYDVR